MGKLLRVLGGEALSSAADLDHAAGRTLPAGISQARKQAGSFPRSLLHAGAGRGGDPAADPPVRLRRGDPVLRHSGHSRTRSVRRCDFEEGRGPVLSRTGCQRSSGCDAGAFTDIWRRSTRRCGGCAGELPTETALIGFCGAPWTVATYMIAGHGTPDQAPGAAVGATGIRTRCRQLMIILVEASADYLIAPDRGGRRRGADLRQLVGRARRGPSFERMRASSRFAEIVRA